VLTRSARHPLRFTNSLTNIGKTSTTANEKKTPWVRAVQIGQVASGAGKNNAPNQQRRLGAFLLESVVSTAQ